MISPTNAPKFQYAVGNQGLRLYKTYDVSYTAPAGAWSDEILYVTVYENDNSPTRFKDYVVNVYGTFTGDPNTTGRWYDMKDYTKSALYREVPAGTIYNFIIDVKQTVGSSPEFNGVTIGIYNTGPSTISTSITFTFKIYVLYSPIEESDFN